MCRNLIAFSLVRNLFRRLIAKDQAHGGYCAVVQSARREHRHFTNCFDLPTVEYIDQHIDCARAAVLLTGHNYRNVLADARSFCSSPRMNCLLWKKMEDTSSHCRAFSTSTLR